MQEEGRGNGVEEFAFHLNFGNMNWHKRLLAVNGRWKRLANEENFRHYWIWNMYNLNELMYKKSI